MQSNAMGVACVGVALVFVRPEILSCETAFLLCESEIGFKRMDCDPKVVLPVGKGLCVGGGTIKITLVFLAKLLVAFLVRTAHVKECFHV